MKRKAFVMSLAVILIAAVISVALWIFTRRGTTDDNTDISLELLGAFIYDNGTVKGTNLSIAGSVHTMQDETLELAIDIKPEDEFQYLFNSQDFRFISDNQKNGDLPHLIICPCYTYNKQNNKSTTTFFALDLEMKAFIAVFRDMPNCYFVAVEGPSSDYNQLLEHFSDFTEVYSPLIWKDT